MRKSNWADFHEQKRFQLVLHLCYFFLVLMLLVALLNSSNEHFSAAPNLFAAGMSGFGLLVLYKTKNYRLVGKICSILSVIIITGAFFFLKAIHFLTPMWMVINILFTFFILGKRWGISILTIHFLILITYVWFLFDANVIAAKHFTTNDLLTFISEFIVVGFALGYIMNLYITTTKFSQSVLEENNAELTAQNALISKQKTEMEVMLKEIHHRVKNNLQIVTSLLRLQANSLGRQGDLFYQEAINRVNAMAMIHEQMYQSNSLSSLDLKRYIEDLKDNLLHSYSINKHVECEMDVSIECLNAKAVVPFALLFNELFANSLKHAFDQQLTPKIGIRLYRMEGDRFCLEYKDNGFWKVQAKDSFGMEIVSAMTEQLEGEKELIIDDSGSYYKFYLVNIGEDK
ncbi:MAG: sensor histidine kinase [Fluviicola sp.]|nr:sensor histidine kinase [Fluviicola sp.]